MGCRPEDGWALNQEQGFAEDLSVAHSKHAPVIAILGFIQREVAISERWRSPSRGKEEQARAHCSSREEERPHV